MADMLDMLREWAQRRFIAEQQPTREELERAQLAGPARSKGLEGAAMQVGKFAYDVVTGIPRFALSIPANIAQATYNAVVPRVTGTQPVKALGSSEEPSSGLAENARQLANAATLRIADIGGSMFREPYERHLAEAGREPSAEQRYVDAPLGAAVDVVYENSGIKAVIEAASGMADGVELSDYDRGRRVVDAFLQLPITAGLLGKAAKIVRPAAATVPRRLLTMADVEAASIRRADIARRLRSREDLIELNAGRDVPAPLTSLTVDELASITNTPKVVPIEETQLLLDSVIEGKVFEQVVRTAVPGTRPFAIASKAIREGGADPALVRGIANLHGIPVDDAARVVGDLLQETATFSGQTLNAFSGLVDELTAKGLRGDVAALDKLRRLEALSKKADMPTNRAAALWTQAMNIMRPIENVRRAAAVSQPATSARNILSQGFTTINSAIEDALTGVVEATVDTLSGGQPARIARNVRPGQYFADVMSDWDAVLRSFNVQERGVMKNLLDEIPLENQRLFSSAYQDATILRGAHGLPVRDPKVADQIAQGLTILNRTSENAFRTVMFRSRLEQNMGALGISDFNNLTEQLRLPRAQRVEGLDAAVTDAVDHALKETFAFVPEAGFGRALLNLYQKAPILTAIGPMFPRFWLNQYRWLFERSPSKLMDLMDPRFREALTSDKLGGLTAKQAARDVAKGMEGLALISAAWQLRNSEVAGPKYYHVKHPTDSEKVVDLRAYQPFVTLLGFAEKLKSMAQGRPFNVSPAEEADLLVGVRRLQDVFLFNIVDLIRADDPKQQEDKWKNLAGQWVSAFLVPGRTIADFASLGLSGASWVAEKFQEPELARDLERYSDEAAKYRDIEDQPFLGPIASSLPVVATILPERVDPFMGEAMRTEDPGLRQLGITIQRMTPLRQLVGETPGLSISELRGDFHTQRANSLVAKHMGQLLETPMSEGGRPLGDLLTDALRSQPRTAEKMQEDIRGLFNAVRDKAREQAEAEEPLAFIEYYMRQERPKSEWEGLRKMLRKAGVM